ncbi:MAG: hypothetical protein J6W03_00535 [Bacteroidaceae bacterium]|nr:hypothetical protein [Bacteroidaceae bacterium]
MSRKTFINIIACLLCLLPALSFAQSLTTYEYWFDDSFSSRQSGSLSGTNTVVRLSVGTDQLDNGVHKFSFRARQSDGKYSAVTSSLFLKRSAAQSSQMEYWFDDNFDGRDFLSISNTEEEQTFELDLRNGTKYPMGFHKLNMRITLEGGGESAVYSAPVLKLAAGRATQLEYWVDDDYANVRTIGGTPTEDGKDYKFVTDLDLGNITPGHHRLYCRPVSNSKITAGAVTSMPIIVKSRYNIDLADAEALTVTEHSYWFDNEEPDVASVSNPRNIITQPYTLDTRKLSDGQHTLHVQYGNSAGIWNGPVDITFTKTHVNDPMIAANVTVEDGVVTLKYTAIPFGQRYIVVRQYPSGTKRKVDDLKSTEYPAALQATDTPAPGTYTYYIEGIYTDVDGQTQKVRSGDMAVTVEHAARTVEKSNIYGIVTVDGERFEDRFPIYESYDITVNGQPINKSPYNYRRRDKGVFVIEDVPHGTELTIGIEYKTYSFNEIKLIVNENTGQKTYRFNCDSGDVHEEQLDNDAFDLDLWNPIALTPDAWEVGVHNKYKYTAWSGDIIVKAISKRVMDLYDREAEEGVSLWYYMLHSNAGLDGGPNYKTVASTHVNLSGGEYRKLPLDIIDVPKGYDEDDRDFYVCIFSKKDDSDEMKPLAGGQRQTLSFNPLDYAPSDYIDDYLISEYKEVLRLLKRMKDWGDPFGFEINTLGGNNLERIITNLGNGTYDIEGLKQDIIVNASNGAGLLLDCFIDDVNNNIVEDVRRNGKEILGRFRISEGIREVCNTLESFYHLNEVDDNHKFLETFKLVMQVSDRLKNSAGIKYPAFEVYKSYFELADAMIDAIENFEVIVQGGDAYEKLISGKGIYKINVRRYTSDGSVQYFSPQEVNKQIRKITFTMETETSFKSESTSCNVDPSFDGLIVTNVNFSPKNNDIYISPQVWMNIYWTNNRVTRIPMLEKHFAKQKDFNTQSPTMTVELQSETYMIPERMANKLTIINQK